MRGVINLNYVRDTFEERKLFIVQYLHDRIDLSNETLKQMVYIKPIPNSDERDSPLTDSNMQRLKTCKSEEEVKAALVDVFKLQSAYELRNIEELLNNVERNKRQFFNSLNVLAKEFREFENHTYQKDIEHIKKRLLDKKKEINTGIENVLEHIEEWEKEKREG